MDHLSESDESFLSNMGLAGTLLAAACFLQHIIFMTDHWLAFSVIPIHILTLVSYILMMKRSSVSLPLLLISSILLFLLEAYMIIAQTFSLVLLILLLYSIVTVALMYFYEIQKKLKQKALAEKQERDKWKNIL